MSNPMQMPKDYITSGSASYLPRAFLSEGASDALRSHAIKFTDVNAVKRELRPLNLIMAHSVMTDGEFSCDERILRARQEGKSAFIVAPAIRPNARIRSRFAEEVLKEMYEVLPETEQEKVAAEMRNVVKMSAGTQGFFGRLLQYFPRKDEDQSKIVPPSDEETALALEYCGLRVDRAAKSDRRPLPIETIDGELGITIARGANLGAPVLAKPQKKSDALAKAISVSYGLEDALTEAYKGDRVNGVAEAYMQLCESQGELMVWIAKTKEDNYSKKNIEESKMRMYLNMPAGPKLFLSQVTQAAEMHAKNCLVDKKTRTAQRAGLAHGNAGKFIEALTAQLQRQKEEAIPSAFLHCGDDSFNVVVVGKVYHFFNCDMSAFDMTQRAVVREPVLSALATQLAAFCPVRAQAWKAFMTMRKIVVSGAATYYTDDGGSSGGVFQSEVNDMLSDVFLQRLHIRIKEIGEELNGDSLAVAVEECGRSLGFIVKLENYQEGAYKSLSDALFHMPMKFLSFYLLPEFGSIRPVYDPYRLFARMPYAGPYCKDKDQFKVQEAVRIASIMLGSGSPFHTTLSLGVYNRAYAVGRRAAARLLQECHDAGLVPSEEAMKIAFNGQVYVGLKEGDETQTLAGLANALRRAEHIWNDPLEQGVVLRLITEDEPSDAVERPPIDPIYFGVRIEGSWADDFPDADELPEEGKMPDVKAGKKATGKAMVKIVPRRAPPVTGPSHGRVPKGTPQKKLTGKDPPKIVPRSAPKVKKVSMRNLVPEVTDDELNNMLEEFITTEYSQLEEKAQEEADREEKERQEYEQEMKERAELFGDNQGSYWSDGEEESTELTTEEGQAMYEDPSGPLITRAGGFRRPR